MVAVPELPDDPTLCRGCIADAGYFEALRITDEDRERTRTISGASQARRRAGGHRRPICRAICAAWRCELLWSRFDRVGLQRIVQLINKTNQFNLTTRRVHRGRA